MVLLHSVIGNSASLSLLIEELSKDFTVIAPDLPGFGLSDPMDETFDIDLIVDVVVSFIETLGLTKPIVYGEQLGAMIASTLTLNNADLVERVILNGFPFEGYDDQQETSTHQFDEPLLALWQNLRTYHLSLAQEYKNTLAQIHQSFLDCSSQDDPFGDVFLPLKNFDGYALLSEMKGPIHFIDYGGHTPPTLPHSMTHASCTRDTLALTIKDCVPAPSSHPVPKPPKSSPLPPPFMTKEYHSFDRWKVLQNYRLGNGKGVVLALHEIGLSSEAYEDVFEDLNQNISIFAPDIPKSCQTVKDMEHFIAAYLKELPEETVILARDAAAGLTLAALQNLDVSLRGIILDQPVAPPIDMVEDIANFMAFDTTPKEYGEHILHAIGRMRDRGLFWPWHMQDTTHMMKDHRQLDPALVHQRVIKALSNPQYAEQLHLALKQPLFDLVANTDCPIAFLANPQLPTARDIKHLSRMSKKGLYLELSGVEGVEAGLSALGF